MSKITKSDLLPPMRPEDLGRSGQAVATVLDVKVDVPSKSTRSGRATIVLLEEYPNKGLYLNETSKDYAVEGMESDETNDWIGKPLPLLVVHSEFKDRESQKTVAGKKVWVAHPDQWKSLIKASGWKKRK